MKEKFHAIQKITSADNGKYKAWQKLLTRKYRERESRFLVEGDLLIKDALTIDAKLKEVIIRSRFNAENATSNDCGDEYKTSLLGEILPTGAGDSPPLYELAENLFDKLSQTEHGREIIGVFEMPSVPVDSWGAGDIVVLDRLQDPGNVGTIIRTADAAGISGIIAVKGTVDIFSPKVVRAAAGSIFRVPTLEVDSIDELKIVLKKLDAKPVAIDPRASVEYFNMPNDERLAIIVGNEGGGISKEIFNLSEMNLVIPMRDGIESLNAAMALGIVIYERVRRRCRKD